MSTISSTVTFGVTLGTGGYNSPLTITGTGRIQPGYGNPSDILGTVLVGSSIALTSTLAGGYVLNQGILAGYNGYAGQANPGRQHNGGAGVLITGGTSLENQGTITGGNAGILLGGESGRGAAGVITSGALDNAMAGTIVGGEGGFYGGGYDGVVSSGVTLTNEGRIEGGGNVRYQYQTGAGEPGGDGIRLTNAEASISNSGIVTGGNGYGFYQYMGSNRLRIGVGGAGISGHYILNHGTVQGGNGENGGAGVSTDFLRNFGTVIGGTAKADAPTDIGGAGAVSAYVYNSGSILGGTVLGGEVSGYGTGGVGIIMTGDGTLINEHGMIAGGEGGGGGDGVDDSSFLTIVNIEGTIAGGDAENGAPLAGIGIDLKDGGYIQDSGLIAGGNDGVGDAIDFGTGASELIVEQGASFTGAVVGDPLVVNQLVLGTTGGMLDMGGSFSGFDSITFDDGAGWVLQGDSAELAAGQTISGFALGDTIVLQGYSETSFSYVQGTGLELSNGMVNETLDITGSSLGMASFHVSASSDQTVIFLLCYLRGTRILTPAGEVPVEALGIGDAVITRRGGYQRIRWIGRQSYDGRFIRNNADRIPVRIAAGALGAGLPKRDLFVSPGHSMLIGDLLILARNLVNGVTITQDEVPDEVHYYQLEFGAHDCVLAEGSWSESFCDLPGLREQFHNKAEFWQLYPEHQVSAGYSMYAPRPEDGPMLEAALRPIVRHAASRVTPGPLRGWIDEVQESGKIMGWAQDIANTELPVDLEILLDGRVIGAVLACDYRDDLASARIGRGRCAFTFDAGARIPRRRLPAIQVRRAVDGEAVRMTADCEARIGLVTSYRRRA